jgi:hypothetical protein
MRQALNFLMVGGDVVALPFDVGIKRAIGVQRLFQLSRTLPYHEAA